MINTKRAALAALLICLLLCACGAESVPEQDGELKLEKTFSDKGVEYFEARVVLPHFKEQGDRSAAINTVLNRELERLTSYVGDELAPFALESYQNAREFGYDFPGAYYTMDAAIDRCDAKCVSLTGVSSAYLGGTHPDDWLESWSFDEKGRQLTLDDLFSVPEDEYLGRIRDLVLKQIDERKLIPELYPDYAETLTETAYDTSDFIPREECLTVYWQDYAIGPHSTGMLLFDLPWSDLGDILAEGWK